MRAIRALLVALAIAGVLPVNDVVAAFCESPAHAEAEAAEPCGDDCRDGCAEKHCAPLDHHCRCCVASAVVPAHPVSLEQLAVTSGAFRWEHSLAPSRTLTPPTRPPIAA